jgi:hypothetical protein
MQEVKAPWPDDAIVDSDATSKETVKDLEEKENDSRSGSGKSVDESQVPSPDGADDEAREPEDAGLM